MLAVKGVDGEASARISRALPFDHVVLGVAEQAVLGAKDRFDRDVFREEKVNDVTQFAINRRLVAKQPKAFAAKLREALATNDVKSCSRAQLAGGYPALIKSRRTSVPPS